MSFSTDITEPGLQADQRLLDRGWLRIGAGLAVAGQAMAFSLAANLTPPEGTAYWIVHGGLILAATGVLVFLGGDLVGMAIESLRQRRISIDLLFLVTLAGAFGGSLIATFTHVGSVYYEVVAILVVVHTTGKMLGARSRVAALRAVDQTRERFDRCDVRRTDGKRVRRAAREVAADDTVVVAPGAPISVDGEIVAGRGYVQETSMTGEWRPVPRGPGDPVLAGTFSVDGSFEIRPAMGPRRLDRVLASVAEARLAPSQLQRQADRFVAWFLPVVAGVSAATFGFWILRVSWDRALFDAMAVLLVACPCAAGLATPIAVWGGLARLASFGLVARTGDFLDVLARCDTVCLDKTGTLSRETLSVRTWQMAPEFAERARWLKAVVAATEEGLAHPIAAAFQTGCHLIDDKDAVVRERRIEPGLGVVARVENKEGQTVEIRVGERALGAAGAGYRPAETENGGGVEQPKCCAGEQPALPPETGDRPSGGKEVFVFVDGAHAATIGLAEAWREGLGEALAELRTLGLDVEILTGDPNYHPRGSELVAGGPDEKPDGRPIVRAGLTPEEKFARVEELKASGRTVAFIGDGVNDSAAMSAAQASVAMQAGAELARAAAMAVFAGDDLRFLPQAIRVARAARRSVQINLRFAAAYNAAGMALAAAGMLHPVVAALLMVGSSAFVSANALRGGQTGPLGPRPLRKLSAGGMTQA